MKKNPKVSKFDVLMLLMVFLTVFLSSCDKKENITNPIGNHTISITNYGSISNPQDPNGVGPKQFTSLTLTPTDSSSNTVTYNFVSNPDNTTISIEVNIPKSTLYRIVIYTADGHFIFWNSIAMAPGGKTTIILLANTNGFIDNSRCNGIPPDGSNIR